MKSFQFFKIYKRFNEERKKIIMQQSMRKEKLRKVGLCFITGCFIKSFNMMINHFLFHKLIFCFAAQFSLFHIRMKQEI